MIIPVGKPGKGLSTEIIFCKYYSHSYTISLTWSLVWFDHEEFDWDKTYLGDDGLLHGSEAAPDLKAYLEIYFYVSLEAE